MKNKSKIKSIILTLGILFTLITISNNNISDDHSTIDDKAVINNEFTVKKPIKSYSETFIHIIGSNWSKTEIKYEWCYLESGMYVIENVIIASYVSGSGILIEDSNHPFIIRNCTIYKCGSESNDAGIKLNNVNNGQIINNNCSFNKQNGIRLNPNCENNVISGNIANNNGYHGIYIGHECYYNTISGNIANENGFCGIELSGVSYYNTISGNIVNNNEYGIMLYSMCRYNTISRNTANNNDYGIYIYNTCVENIISGNLLKINIVNGILVDYANCWNNTIYQNSLIGTLGWHACDDGTNTKWDYSGIGNYWDNHTSHDSDNDGIVDNSYTNITGSAPSVDRVDHFPLAESPVHVGNKIHIDDSGVLAPTWSRTAELNLWCTGTGTYSNPYEIDGLEIDARGSGSCICINNSQTNYFIIKNCILTNASSEDAGIKLENTCYGTLFNNNCSYNKYMGINIRDNSDNNTISGNIVNNNEYGISLNNYCDNNTILGNTANNSRKIGININKECDENIISGNIACNNSDHGILIRNHSDNNTISGNIFNNNSQNGIYIRIYSNNNTISGNTVNENFRGIDLRVNSSKNIITGNILNYNDYGIVLSSGSNSSIISGNLLKNNIVYGLFINDIICKNNLIYQNSLIGTGGWHACDDGTNTKWDYSGIGNYWDNHTSPDSDNDGIVDNSYTNITGSAPSADRVDHFPLAESPIHAGDKIYIDDSGLFAPTWSRTAELNFWCTGSGIFSDPYIIDGLEINGGGSGSCIYINNSQTNYFIIKNCNLTNGGGGSFTAGITLENTNNGTLENNNCSLNSVHGICLFNYCENNNISGNIIYDNGYGIYLFIEGDYNIISGNIVNENTYGIHLNNDCDYNIISGNTVYDNIRGIFFYYDCDDNNITGNIINDNDFGIYIWDDCDDNKVIGNLLKINVIYGIYVNDISCKNNLFYQNSLNGTIGWHACDEGTNTEWDYSGVGNYWDNHTSPDSDNDGIVDNSYTNITGSAPSADNYPLVESPVYEGEKIHIDDSGVNSYNWSVMAKVKLWCTGSGTSSKPYEITGLEIDGGGSGNCITIEYSNIPFIIRNCKIYNAGYYDLGAGIKFYNVSNGQIIDNNCSFNGVYGICLQEFCEDNIISGNTVNNNKRFGIVINGYCNGNTISGNTVNNNKQEGIVIHNNCDDNNISDNIVNNNGIMGIDIYDMFIPGIGISDSSIGCNGNTLSGNTVNDNGKCGIYMNNCNDSTISGNSANRNMYGLELVNSDNNRIINNAGTFADNTVCGIFLWYSDYNTLYGNRIFNNLKYGICLNNSNYNTIYDNIFYGNGIDISDNGIGNTFTKPVSIIVIDGDDDDDDDEKEEIEFLSPILITVGIISAIGVAGVAIYLIRKRR